MYFQVASGPFTPQQLRDDDVMLINLGSKIFVRSLTITIHAFLSAVLSSRVRGAEAFFASARSGDLLSSRVRGAEAFTAFVV